MILGTSKNLYYEIIEAIIKQILNEEIKAGDKIPSVREQAKNHKMNPQTVQKAYNILIEEDILIPKMGSGNYVTNNTKILATLKNEFIDNEISKFISIVNKYNINKELVVKKLEENEENNAQD